MKALAIVLMFLSIASFAACTASVLYVPAHAAPSRLGCGQILGDCICSVQPKGIRGYGPGSDSDAVDGVCTDMRTMGVTYFTVPKSQAPFSSQR